MIPNVATGHSLEEAPRSSLPLGGGCLLGNSCFAIYILLLQLYPVASRGLLRERKTSPLHQGTGCHNPTPGWQGTRCKQSQCWCSEETLVWFNSGHFRGFCCQGEAGFETRDCCQSCCSFSSKLTRGYRRRLCIVPRRSRRGMEGEGGEGAAVLCTVLSGVGACHCHHHHSPGGERGAWNRRRRVERCVVARGGGPASPSRSATARASLQASSHSSSF